MRVPVLPRDVAAGIITGSVAMLGWAIGAVTLVLAFPVLVETLVRAGRAADIPLPAALLLIMLVSLGLVVWRERPWAVAAYLVVGFVASVSYELNLLSVLPGSIETQVYVLNRPAAALVLVGLAARRPIVGIAWSTLGFVVSTLSTVVVAAIAGVPFRPGYAPIFALVVSLAAYLTLWGVQVAQRRRVPNIEELEAENARLSRGEDLARRTTAAVHDTLLNDLSVVMNAPDELDARARARLVEDLETLRGAEWLQESSRLTMTDEQDTLLRNEVGRLISEFQWRGLSVHVTGSGDGIYRLDPAVATALVEALRAALENVARHSGASVAEVELVYTPDSVTIMVTDEGVGFDPATVPDDRLGLRASIKDRLSAVGGEVQIWSSPGSGTSIVMTSPVRAMVRPNDPPHHQESR
ncbi:sensor histidine kinase [Lysinimonas soli]|uniref:histidine kinase n=1 Tax=Lysinimonas soli TaxID=1074233 RepID=A0ABW0NKS0_9MICO